MSRPSRVRALLLLILFGAAGCQDYNFNPVGHCLIQPGTERVTLSIISTADVLFVVDDSGSMGGKQVALAQAFSAFITQLDQTNAARQAAGLEAIDFHLAVTTTSVFLDNPTTASCRSDCPGTGTSQVCCTTSGDRPIAPLHVPKTCSGNSDCSTGYCGTDCTGLLGDKVCCDATTKAVSANPADQAPVACATPGAACGSVQTHFTFDSVCAAGNATNGARYPQGDFVGAAGNPRVLHFDKQLYDPAVAKNKQGYTRQQLIDFFASQPSPGTWRGNVIVGTCGSGEEQALEAGRLAVEKAVAKQQMDTVDGSGQSVASPAEWLHDNSKLVLVFVGDEDDCSSPQDPTGGVILSGPPGDDTCVHDGENGTTPKRFPVSDIVGYFASLGRPMGAAFIVSTFDSVCQDQSCTPGQCCGIDASGNFACPDPSGALVCRTATCGGQAGGIRLLDAYGQLSAAGADTVAGSVCDPHFDQVLQRIAEIVKPPAGLILPTQPAASVVTLLRIADVRGLTRKTCTGPAPVGTSGAGLDAYDWWFTATRDPGPPSTPTRYIYINHSTGNCEANPGETYAADYLGLVPSTGCTSDADCAAALGGQAGSWTCDGYQAGPPAVPGTCLCY